MKWVNKPTECPLCNASVGEPLLAGTAWVVQCWNSSCRALLQLEVQEVRALEVTKVNVVQGRREKR